MAGLSDYLERKLLDHSLGVASYTMPTALYAALFTTDPTDADTGTEVSTTSTGYARKPVTFGASTTDSSNGTTTATNNADVLYDVATAAWGTLTYVGLFDAVTGGNMLWSGAMSTAQAINTNDQFKLPVGKIVIQLD